MENENRQICFRGIEYVGLNTEPYTESKLKAIHQRIYTELHVHGLQLCTAQCSAQKKPHERWCGVCNGWREKLCSVLKHPGAVSWKNLESWKWPTAYEHIVPVFLNTKGNIDGSTTNLSDLTVACKIWINCKEVNINPVYVSNVQKARNDVTHKRKFTSLDKGRVFDALRDVLNDPDVTAEINSTVCLKELAKIQKGDETRKLLLVLRAQQEQFHADTTTSLKDLGDSIQNKQDSEKTCTEKNTEKFRGKSSRIIIFMFALILVLVIVSIYLLRETATGTKQMTESESKKDCVSENYTQPFPQDLPLLGYLHDHSNLVGREWLLSEIENELLKDKGRFPHRTRGFVISADIGYGKSAIMRHLLCASENQKGHILRQHMVAFHICKFDVPSTQSPERFIRRLVGFFATKSVEYGRIISESLPYSSVLYNREGCRDEIEACFDQAFRIPLKQMNDTDNIWLIGIDALDECYSSEDRKNLILELLLSRIMYFPNWIKFFITARHFDQLKSLEGENLQTKVLSAKDPNNIDDIKAYVNEAFPKDQNKLNEHVVKNLISKSDGNFHYIIQAVKFMRSQSDLDSEIPDVPETLKKIYEYNFDRHFNKGQTFGICKMILEVICTSLKPITADTIFQILKDAPSLNGSQDMFKKEFQKLFSYINENGTITIKHEAVHSWLLDKSNSKYRISLESGHDLFSKYLIKQERNLKSGNIVDLVMHLSKSGNEELQNLYHSTDLRFDRFCMHDLISRTSSADALGLLLQKYENVDIKNENQMTPAFLAASKGHLEQLKLLHRQGADITFQVPGCRCMTLGTTDYEVDLIEMHYYTGYTLLHIAVQHNFLDIVKFLTDQKEFRTIMNITNSIGMRAIDYACVYGDLQILELIHKRCDCIIDEQCVYFAVKNGNKEVVKYAFENGFTEKCITMKRAQNVLKSLTEPCSCTTHQRYKQNVIWLICQETMLHTAIIHGFAEIAEMIYRNQQDLEKCSDASGYTPQLLAVKYGMANLFKHLIRKAFISTCTSVADHIKDIIERKELKLSNLIDADFCRDGGNFAHILAIYDRKEILAVLEELNWVDWTFKDERGNIPLHYAVCSSLSIVRFYKRKFGTKIFLERRNDGASAFHLAVHCNRNSIVKEITNSFSEDLTHLALHNLKDRAERNILHYVASIQQQSVLLHEKHKQNSALSVFLYFAKFINLTDVDFQGNSVAHFLVQNGHFDILEYYQNTLTTANFRAVIILPLNKERLNPVEFGLILAPFSTFFWPSDILNAFGNKQVMPLEEIKKLQNTYLWEVCLIMLTEFMTGEEIEAFAEKNAFLMVLKAPFLTKAVLKKINLEQTSTTFIDTIRKSIIDTIMFSHGSFRLRKLASYSLLAIFQVNASIIHTCSVPLMVSPIHYISLNSLEIELYSYTNTTIDFIWMIVKKAVKLDCRTSEGYNILHYAFIGGNLRLVMRLKSEGAQLLAENVTAADILYHLSHARFTTDKSSLETFDRFASDFIEENRGGLRFTDFCHNGSRSLSLIHILVINRMDKTVEKVLGIFGIEVLHCINMHGFSPGYFALLFDRTYITSLISNYHIKHTEPMIDAEESLIANLINDVPLVVHKSAYASLVMSSIPMNAANIRSLLKLYRNLGILCKTELQLFFFENAFTHVLVYIRQGLYLFRKLFISTRSLQSCVITMIKTKKEVYDWYFVAMASVRKSLLNLQHWSEKQYSSLVWTKEYPFLRSIQKILHLSKVAMNLPPVYSKVSSNANGQSNLLHAVSYLQRVSNVLLINLKNIYLFRYLADQEMYKHYSKFPFTLSDELIDRFTGRFEHLSGSGGLKTGAVYRIGFSYLNQIQKTTAYREIFASLTGTEFTDYIDL